MRRDVIVAQVFLAGPNDVDEERRQIQDVIDELNLTWSHSGNIRLELVTWHTHAQPGVGVDPQDVVNRTMPSEYDIFIGVMWSRFGSPTGRAGSGTEEEFNRALERYRRDPGSVRIMFYFKDDPVAPSQLDIDQLTKVLGFKRRLEEEGVLYFTFTRTLDATVRIHLARQIQEWLAKPENTRHEDQGGRQDAGANIIPNEGNITAESQEDLGVFDCMDLFLSQIGTFSEARARAIAAIFELYKKMLERDGKDEISGIPAAKERLSWMAELLEALVTRMRKELPIISETFRSAMDNLGKR